jgi:hypothetical protein
MQLSHYERVPAAIAEEAIAQSHQKESGHTRRQ